MNPVLSFVNKNLAPLSPPTTFPLMSTTLLFWVLMLFWLVFGLWSNWPLSGGNAKTSGGNLLLFILLAILGWKVFGAAIHS
jgi:hypothetical protein